MVDFYVLANHHFCETQTYDTHRLMRFSLFCRFGHVLCKVGRGFLMDSSCGSRRWGTCQPQENGQFYSKRGLREKEITRTVWDVYVFQWLIVSNLFICTIFVGCSSIIHMAWCFQPHLWNAIVSVCSLRTRHNKATQSARLCTLPGGWGYNQQVLFFNGAERGMFCASPVHILSQTQSVNHCCGR